MTLLYSHLTHTGLVREHNEDQVLAKHFARADGREFDLLAVADGMGGHSRGEVASQLAVDALSEYLEFAAWNDPAQALSAAFELANARVHEAPGDMGTTLVAVLFDTKSAMYWVANVGDSRAYLLARGRLTALTSDHSAVAARVEAGLMTREEAEQASGRNVLLRAIGPDPDVEIDVYPPRQLKPGERLLLCSDGVHAMLRERDIARIGWSAPLSGGPGALIDAANRAGGRDNISVVLAALEATDATVAEIAALSAPPAAATAPRLALLGLTAAGVALIAGALAFVALGGGSSETKADAVVTATNTAEATFTPSHATASPPSTAGKSPTPRPTINPTPSQVAATVTTLAGDVHGQAVTSDPPPKPPTPTATPAPTLTPTPASPTMPPTSAPTPSPAASPSSTPPKPTPIPLPLPDLSVSVAGDNLVITVTWARPSDRSSAPEPHLTVDGKEQATPAVSKTGSGYTWVFGAGDVPTDESSHQVRVRVSIDGIYSGERIACYRKNGGSCQQ